MKKAHLIIVDDPQSDEQLSDEVMARVRAWYDKLVIHKQSPESDMPVIVGPSDN